MASKRATGILTAAVAGVIVLVAAAATTFVVISNQRDQPDQPPKDLIDPGARLGLPARINAGGPASDSGGQPWMADAAFVGGIAESSGQETAEPIYRTIRRGVSAYRLAVDRPGVYRVTLHLIEPTFGTGRRRVFDVLSQGRPVLREVDIAAEVGKGQPYQRTFDARVDDGVLDVGFLPRVDLPVLAGLVVERSPAAKATASPAHLACHGVPVRPGQNARTVLAAHPPGTTYCFKAGVHRLSAPLVPKGGDVLAGDAGAVLNGSRPLTGWTSTGSAWQAKAAASGPLDEGRCVSGTACRYTNDVYLDNRPLRRVLHSGEVGHDTFWQDAENGLVLLGDDPTGHTVEQAVAPAAISGEAGRVTVSGLVVEKFAVPAQHAAVYADGPDWRILDNEVRLNHGGGIRTDDGTQAIGNSVHRNGQLGMGGNGDGTVVRSNVIALSNYSRYDPNWEAGASKWAFTADLKVTGNNVYSNGGPGLWSDLDNIRTTMSGNIVANNALVGIFEEISCSGVVSGNIVVGNGFSSPFISGWLGGAGIGVNTSADVDIAGNTVVDNANGIGLIASDREEDPGESCGAYKLENVRVHDNLVQMRSGRSGVVEDAGDASIFDAADLRFAANTYRLDRVDRAAFAWRAQNLDRQDWLEVGQDAGSRFEPTAG
jgi:Malectin domain/Right handed beta helix region